MKNKLKELSTKEVTSEKLRKLSSFTYLNVTQFLGALNDNIYKLLIVFFFLQLDGVSDSHWILSLSGAIFVIPFLFFSASSGMLADRFSKRNIIVLTKLLELIVMAGAILAFYFESRWGSWLTLFLLATQSAIFGPSKYGIIPELVKTEKISQANGLMTSFTFLAIIIGTFFASFLLDITGRNFLFAAIFCGSLSLVGLITSFCIEYTPPSGTHKRFNVFFITEIMQTLKTTLKIPSLFTAVMGSSFFLFIGAFGQLNMIPYAVHTLHLTDIQGGYLFLIMAVGIGIGSLISGKISGASVELGLVPLAGMGICVSCYLLDFYSDNVIYVLPVIFFLGVLGGIYVVPLDSFIQVNSPTTSRGQVVAATNFLSFMGVLLASLLLYLITGVFGLEPDKGFTVVGTITMLVTIAILFQYFDYSSRLAGMLLSRLHFRTTLSGEDALPQTPVVYICTHTAWNDTLLLLGAQRLRLRFFVEKEQEHKKWMKQLYKMLRIVNMPAIEPLDKYKGCVDEIKQTLSRGVSVCLFVENVDVCKEWSKLMRSYSFQDLGVPIIPVSIEKGTKEKEPRLFKRLLNKIHVPASVSFGTLVCE
jgi:acyl-[acyl-carrier-protein]-phospholipid O-acyltransferase / long-chain-fatty-acid--[acyl-carrier-protein] ligase